MRAAADFLVASRKAAVDMTKATRRYVGFSGTFCSAIYDHSRQRILFFEPSPFSALVFLGRLLGETHLDRHKECMYRIFLLKGGTCFTTSRFLHHPFVL